MTSHEIRNPLSAMIHCTEEIIENCQEQSEGFIESSLEAAYTIEYCAKHIRNIVGDVLMLSKLDSKLVEVCPVATRPRSMVQEALKMFSGEARAQDIEMTYSEHVAIQTLSVDWLLLDPNRMLQVLVNLVTNAIKFTRARPDRKIVVSLDASLELPSKIPGDITYIPRRLPWTPMAIEGQLHAAEPLYLIVSVEDTGLGLTQLEKTVLFERFKQASPKTETKYGGSGLGLFISRDLTEIQGGEIGVRSEPGVGSKFIFYVETHRVDAPAQVPTINIPEIAMSVRHSPVKTPVVPLILDPMIVPPELGASSKATTRADRSSASTSAGRKILVVEDNLVNQKVLAKQLRKRGFDVATAENGEEALKSLYYTHRYRLTTSAFDLVLMDIEMPIMDGIACVRAIRAAEAEGKLEGHVPVIAVTANVREEQSADAWAAGVDEITTKPYRIDELVAKIDKICGAAAPQ
jgi:CheY-like chemotaxis protein